jgi:hypothetical protein
MARYGRWLVGSTSSVMECVMDDGLQYESSFVLSFFAVGSWMERDILSILGHVMYESCTNHASLCKSY